VLANESAAGDSDGGNIGGNVGGPVGGETCIEFDLGTVSISLRAY
jgi:hypothetical protein